MTHQEFDLGTWSVWGETPPPPPPRLDRTQCVHLTKNAMTSYMHAVIK